MCKEMTFRPIEMIKKKKIIETIKNPKFIEIQRKISVYMQNNNKNKTKKKVQFNITSKHKTSNMNPNYQTDELINNQIGQFDKFCKKSLSLENSTKRGINQLSKYSDDKNDEIEIQE